MKKVSLDLADLFERNGTDKIDGQNWNWIASFSEMLPSRSLESDLTWIILHDLEAN